MQGTSRESLAAARENLDALIRSGGVDLLRLGDDLFAVADVLGGSAALRRALADPARSGDDRAELARSVFGGRIAEPSGDVLAWVVRARWSGPRDLVDAVELLAAEALVAQAEQARALDDLEDDLFRVGRLVAGNARLRAALTDHALPEERRLALLDELVADRVGPATLRLLHEAVRAPRGTTFERAVDTFVAVAADRRSRLVATVTAPMPLTEEQRDRLAGALANLYGNDVRINVEVDPELLGGLRIEIGGELIDGSIRARLDTARRRLAG